MEVAFPKVVLPVKVLLSPSKVDEAALMTMLAEPLKLTPLIVRAVWRTVAVPALPLTASRDRCC